MICIKISPLVAVWLLFCTITINAQKKTFSSFDGTQIAYSDEGNGFPVLLVHGFINTGNSWNKTVVKRELLHKGYRVIVPDLRGNGDSDKPHNASAFSDDAEIKDLIALTRELKLETYWSVGYSRGSILLAKLLTQDNRIEKAVLGGMGLDFTNPDWDRKLMFAAAFNGQLTPETEGAVTYAKSIGADLRCLHLQQLYQPVTSIEQLKQIEIKVLVLAGDKDKDNGDPAYLDAALPNSILKIVTGDHNGTYKKEEFSEAVLHFLE